MDNSAVAANKKRTSRKDEIEEQISNLFDVKR
jgi:hypothetical protein